MTCDELSRITGWICLPSGENSIKAVAPLCLGEDGQHLSFFIASPGDGSFLLTDACETAMHAEQMGVILSKSRIEALNETCGVEFATFNSSMEITAEGPKDMLALALWDATKLAMALTFRYKRWQPKFHQLRFRKQVEQALSDLVGPDELIKSPKVLGMSGHELEFPFAVRSPAGRLAYIEPIATQDNHRLDWSHIYQASGKMSDIKMADEISARVVVLEKTDLPSDYGKAATLLSQYAQVNDLESLSGTVNRHRIAA